MNPMSLNHASLALRKARSLTPQVAGAPSNGVVLAVNMLIRPHTKFCFANKKEHKNSENPGCRSFDHSRHFAAFNSCLDIDMIWMNSM